MQSIIIKEIFDFIFIGRYYITHFLNIISSAQIFEKRVKCTYFPSEINKKDSYEQRICTCHSDKTLVSVLILTIPNCLQS